MILSNVQFATKYSRIQCSWTASVMSTLSTSFAVRVSLNDSHLPIRCVVRSTENNSKETPDEVYSKLRRSTFSTHSRCSKSNVRSLLPVVHFCWKSLIWTHTLISVNLILIVESCHPLTLPKLHSIHLRKRTTIHRNISRRLRNNSSNNKISSNVGSTSLIRGQCRKQYNNSSNNTNSSSSSRNSISSHINNRCRSHSNLIYSSRRRKRNVWWTLKEE